MVRASANTPENPSEHLSAPEGRVCRVFVLFVEVDSDMGLLQSKSGTNGESPPSARNRKVGRGASTGALVHAGGAT
jgi:hypothetical protein